MVEYTFSERAYAKMIFHAAKYPHLAVNGLLLGDKSKDPGSSPSTVVQVTDAVPLFHQCLYLAPMTEIALMQIDAFADREQMAIVGYYAAGENFYDSTVDKAPGAPIADKIHDNFKNSCFIVIDNKLVSLTHECPAIKVFTSSGSCSNSASDRWTKAKFALQHAETTLEAVSALLKRGAMKDIIDFDNHLDNPQHDWTNKFLNRDLKQIMAMY